ncbi:MAG TPA: hypothetical protein VJ824_04555 [Bacillota bacterium]|nr:hypothetical protein [Bacillota bacterium]
MGLKSAIFELTKLFLEQKHHDMEEQAISDLEMKHQLKVGTLVSYFNALMMVNLSEYQNKTNGEKINRKWSKSEIEFMHQYINDRQDEGAKNITDILDEIAQILGRGYQSVNYKYYSIIKDKKSEKKMEEKSDVNALLFKTIEQEQLPVISVSTESQEVDLLDLLSGFISNIQQLPGIHLNELLRSLYLLSSMAIQNRDADQHLVTMKLEMSKEKENLAILLRKKEQQLMVEKKRNNELQAEVSKLAKEIATFNQLGDAAKVQNLKSYNQRLKYIIDGFGGVLQIGS